jgi:hypothetical protein
VALQRTHGLHVLLLLLLPLWVRHGRL